MSNLGNEIKEKLEEEQEYTYKELCTLLHQKYYSGNNGGKKKELANWSRYFEYYKGKNRKLHITKIYDEPKPEIIREPPTNAIYVKYIEVILLHYLSTNQSNKKVMYLTPRRLWMLLGMTNGRYFEYSDNAKKKKELITEYNSKFEIDNFYKRSRSRLNTILNNSLNSLRRRKLILCQSDIYIIGIQNDNYDDQEDKNPYNYREATEEESRQIMAIERETFEEMGYNEDSRYNNDLSKEYYERCNTKYKERYGWDFAYKCYKIIYNQTDVARALPKDECRLERLKLNYLTTNSINKQAVSNYNNNKYKLEEKIADEGYLTLNDFKYSADYIDIQAMLADKLLRLDQTDDEKSKVEQYFKKGDNS